MKIHIEIDADKAAFIIQFCKAEIPTLDLKPTSGNNETVRFVAVSEVVLDFYKLGLFVAQTYQPINSEKNVPH